MQKFLVLFMAPASVMAEWMQKPETERKEAEAKMQADWQAWMQTNGSAFVDAPAGAGKAKNVTGSGVEDKSNDVMMYATVMADSIDAAAALFSGHPHFGIPAASIEVMPIKVMSA